MLALFRLLLQTSYWRMLFRKATWPEVWRSVRRAHKDRRARKHVLGVVTLSLAPILCLLYLGWLIGTGALVFVPFVLPVLWWLHRRRRQEDTPLSILPASPPADLPLTPAETSSLRLYLAELALFYAVLVDRAGSETFLKHKVLPDDLEVISRRNHLNLLRTHDLWDRIAPTDREALMMADGHWDWDWEQINDVSLAIEPLRLLRWLLGLDFFLPVIGQQLRVDYNLAHDLVYSPARLFPSPAKRSTNSLRDAATIRVGRDAAQNFFGRCLAESIHRGYHQAGSDETLEWSRDLTARLGGNQHEDLVLEDTIVSDAPEETVILAVALAGTRIQFLNWILSLRDGAPHPTISRNVWATAPSLVAADE